MNGSPALTKDGRPKRYFLETYGCQMNEYDSTLVAGVLEERGYTATTEVMDADLILVNTCSVRDKAEETALSKLTSVAYLRRRRPEIHMGVLGCMAERKGDTIRDRIPEVNILLGPDHYDKLGSVLDELDGIQPPKSASRIGPDIRQTYEGVFPAAPSNVSAYVAIQRGCGKKCSYCIVPFTRGPERSRPSHDILEETRRLVDKGVREITLLGQTVNAWRSDLMFADLLRALGKIDHLERIRFMSPHPRHFTDSVCQAMAEVPAVCPHVHMPVQSGSSRILRQMKRQYSRDQFLSIVDRIRRWIPDASITTDIIAGYPGETLEDHQATLSIMDAVRFDSAFMFAYSPRPGTPAALEIESIDEPEKLRRLQEIIDIQHQHTFQRLEAQVGLTTKILLEGKSRKNSDEWIGKTPQMHKVVVVPLGTPEPGQILTVQILSRRGQILWGECVP